MTSWNEMNEVDDWRGMTGEGMALMKSDWLSRLSMGMIVSSLSGGCIERRYLSGVFVGVTSFGSIFVEKLSSQ